MRVERSIEISASPEKVWPFLSKPEKILQWYAPLQRFEYTGQQKGGVGAPFRFVEKTAAGTVRLDCVVTEWVEDELFAFRMISGTMMKEYAERWTVEALQSGCRFTFREEGELGMGVLGRVLQPLAERGSGAVVEGMLTRLKSLAEA